MHPRACDHDYYNDQVGRGKYCAHCGDYKTDTPDERRSRISKEIEELQARLRAQYERRDSMVQDIRHTDSFIKLLHADLVDKHNEYDKVAS